MAVFGKRTGDSYNKIYKTTNSGNNWDEITDYNHRLPNTTSLTINPFNNNQLWIGTTGSGTFIFDGLTIGISVISSEVPSKFKLYQNYPNPFNPATRIIFDVADYSMIRITIFDALGREIKTLVNENLKSGKYEIKWNAENYASGVYYYQMTEDNFVQTRKMILLK
jgi:hypothetical protein